MIKFYRILGKFFTDIARYFWRKDIRACDYCGALVGMNCVISRYGCACWQCHESLRLGHIKPYIKNV